MVEVKQGAFESCYGLSRILEQTSDSSFMLDLPHYLGKYLTIDVESLQLFTLPLLNDDDDDQVILSYVDDSWFDKEESLKEDVLRTVQ